MIMKKGQAALEFLMTYGWAILVVLVSIGALAYFGVLSPEKFLPAKCILQSGITCLDHKATSTTLPTGVTIYIQNNIGYDIDQIDVSTSSCGAGLGKFSYLGIPPGAVGSSGATTLGNGAQGTYFLPCTFTSTSKYSGQLNVSYRVIETQITHNNVGSITTRIE